MPRSPKDNQKLRDDRRDAIRTAALRVFAARGLAGARMAEIAAAAGTSQGLAYHYFASKEELYTDLVRGALARMNAAARGLEAMDAPPREKIWQALSALLASTARDDAFGLYFLLVAQASTSDAVPPEAKAALRDERGVVYEVVARILAAGQADGSVRPGDPAELAVAFWTMVRGVAIHRAAHGPGATVPSPGTLARVFFPDEPPAPARAPRRARRTSGVRHA